MNKVQEKNVSAQRFVSKHEGKRQLEDSVAQEGLLTYESRSQTCA